MSLDTWSGRNELLNKFHAAIEKQTHGRLSHLSLDVIEGALVVDARSATYYAVQLALAAVQAFAAEFPKLAPAKMSFRVNGHSLVLSNLNAGGNGHGAGNDDVLIRGDSLLPDRHRDEQSLHHCCRR
jgi:hypothetical protein